jgi:hypothetical protein
MKLHHVVLPLAAMLTLSGCFQLFSLSLLSSAVALPSFVKFQERSKEALQANNCMTTCLALEQYCADHDGVYPPQATWLQELVKGKPHYLPEDRLPASSYGKQFHQTNDLTVAEVPGLAPAGQPATPVGTVLDDGHLPDHDGMDGHTYGAIAYGVNPTQTAYVLYGIGQRRGKAVVVFAHANGVGGR